MVCVVVVIALFALTGLAQKPAPTTTPAREQWEYRTVHIPERISEEIALRALNEAGAQGWEVVVFQPGEAESLTGFYLMKRLKQ